MGSGAHNPVRARRARLRSVSPSLSAPGAAAAGPAEPANARVLSAAQLNDLATNIAAQRRRIQTLRADLKAFDQQLAVLEHLANLGERLTGHRPAGEGRAADGT